MSEFYKEKRSIKHDEVKDQIVRMYEWSTIRPSPFEGIVKGVKILDSIRKYFQIIRKKNTRCFMDGITRDLSFISKLVLAYPLKIVVNLFLKLQILKERRMVIARPKSGRNSRSNQSLKSKFRSTDL